jgi:hypothetical protein
MVALSPVAAGGAAFTVQPGSLPRARAEAERLLAAEPEWCAALSDDYRTTTALSF